MYIEETVERKILQTPNSPVDQEKQFMPIIMLRGKPPFPSNFSINLQVMEENSFTRNCWPPSLSVSVILILVSCVIKGC